MAKTAEQKKKEAAAMKIWAAKHGKLAKKVLEKKTKQSGRKAINTEVHKSSLALKNPVPATKSKAVTKPTSTKAVRSTSTSSSSSKTKGDGSVKAIPVKRSGSTEVKNNKPVQAKSKPIKSNPALKTQPPKASTRRTERVKEDPRVRGLRNNVSEMKADTRKRNQKKAFTNTGIPARPSKNPKKGDVYKQPFGNVMVYNGTKWVRK
jgi:hypothetical protein